MTFTTRSRFFLTLEIDLPADEVGTGPVADGGLEGGSSGVLGLPGEDNPIVQNAIETFNTTAQQLLDGPSETSLEAAAQAILLAAASDAAAGSVDQASFGGDNAPGGATLKFQITQFNATFAINRIPMASATLAVGRNARTLQAALIHTRSDSIRKMLRARVSMTPIGQWSASDQNSQDPVFNGKWTQAGTHRVFDGYVTGIGYQKIRGALRISVQLIHWLSDLAFSSIFSNQSHPVNPVHLNFRAVYGATAATATAAASAFIGAGRYANKFNGASIQDDLWAKGLANVFCETAQQDMVQLGSPERCGGIDARNDFSLAALARIEGPHDCRTSGAIDRWHVPLTLNNLGGDQSLVSKAISQYVSQQTLKSWWSTTIWEKLVNEFAPAFMFHVIPRVETAIVAPFVAGLRSAWPTTIFAQDVSRLFIQSYIRRPLRGVAIYAGRDSHTGVGDTSGLNVPVLNGVGGCFLPDEDARGMVLFKRAPSWMATIPNFVSPPSKTVMGRLGAGDRVRATNSATTPLPIPSAVAAAIGAAGALGLSVTKGAAAVKNRRLHDRMAQFLYMSEVLRGRSGTLVGKFRMDIAPGTTVFIEDIGEQVIEAFAREGLFGNSRIDIASPNLYATVKTVELGIDAETRQAVTVFELAHIRTPKENTDDRTSVDSHPLYLGQRYLGAPLVDEYLFS